MDVPKPKKISEVFTPRSAVVNPAMYITRPILEKELKRAIHGSLHAILTGESGGGKTWLFKHVAKTEGWKTFYANAANAARHKSMAETIQMAINDVNDKELNEYSQKIAAKAEPLGMGGSSEAERKYKFKRKDVLFSAFKDAREKGTDKIIVLVIDNLEAIFTKKDLMEELGNIVLLLDDEEYAQFSIKLLIIGVPSDVVEYYRNIDYLETIANRIKELPQVVGLNTYQIEDFLKRGFLLNLKFLLTAPQIREIASHLENVTLGIAQRLHEYCEILAYNIEDSGWKYDSGLLKNSDEKFLHGCLKKSYAVVDGYMNERKTKTGRRNQVIYALGKIGASEFNATEIEVIIRDTFPESTYGTKLAVGQMLADLSKGPTPLIRKSSKSVFFRFADTRYLMCIRVMLSKPIGSERVIKATFRR